MTKPFKANTSYLNELLELTIKDPLFSAEGVDIDNALWALEELESVSRDLGNVSNAFSDRFYNWLYPLTKTLHPFRFLRSFLEGERIKRRFLAKPNISNAQDLLRSYYSTNSALEKDLKSHLEACVYLQNQSYKKNPSVKAYNYFARAVLFSEYTDFIKQMIVNTKQLQLEINGRNKLLLKNLKSLAFQKDRTNYPIGFLWKEKYSVSPNGKVVKPNTKGSSNRLNKLSQTAAGRIKENWPFKYFFLKRYGGFGTEIFDSIQHKHDQYDLKPKTHDFFAMIINDSGNNPRLISIQLTDQFHFIELAKSKYSFHADSFIYEPLIRRRINYWYQPATMYYFTPNLGYLADIATKVDNKRRPFLNKQALINQKSSLLDLLLWNGYFHNYEYLQNVKALLKTGHPVISWHYILVVRSYSSLYYLPFNKSVWRLKNPPAGLGRSVLKSSEYITLDQLPAALSEKEFLRIFEGGRIRAEDVDTYLQNLKK